MIISETQTRNSTANARDFAFRIYTEHKTYSRSNTFLSESPPKVNEGTISVKDWFVVCVTQITGSCTFGTKGQYV